MDELVEFGRYAGQPVRNLVADKGYLNWCIKKGMDKRYNSLKQYNILINGRDTDIPTPDHNRLQNFFLERKTQEALINIFPPDVHHYKAHSGMATYTNKKPPIEEYKWCVTLEGRCNWDVILEMKMSYTDEEGDQFYCHDTYYCELKPTLGDEYPCVLRKMRQQMEVTKNLGYGSRCILIVTHYDSIATTWDQLKTIFKQHNIHCIRSSEIIDIANHFEG